ncbi:MAG: peptidase S24 [Variovorax paradoxus]|nr:MAG: peptidase S24 [Variovorax paradoxus]PZQ03153.1 MAG: peptidase S24 [Variovorax paradoxus]
MDLSNRIREAITGSGKSAASIAREIGVTQSSLSQILNRGVKGIKAETAAALELATGYRMQWLVTGKGPKLLHGNIGAGPAAEPEIPLISWVQAGGWQAVHDNFQPGDADEWLPCPVRHSSSTFALRVRGMSMYDPGGEVSFRDNDIIFVDPEREAQHRSLVVVRLDDEAEATFKQLLIEGTERFLQALNPSWPNRIIPINGHATLCGVVIARLQAFA